MARPPKVAIPLQADSFVYFVDEAGSKGTLGDYFVTATVRTDDPDFLSRSMKEIREKHGFSSTELKYRKVSKNSLPFFAEVFQSAVSAGCGFGAFVLDKRSFDPWSTRAQWEGHLFATERLLRGMISRREVAVILLDHIDVPRGVSYGGKLMNDINSRFGNKRVVASVSLDSRTSPALQVADLLASSIFYTRKKVEEMGLEGFLSLQTPKARLARQIAEALEAPLHKDCVTNIFRMQTSFPDSSCQYEI